MNSGEFVALYNGGGVHLLTGELVGVLIGSLVALGGVLVGYCVGKGRERR